MQAHTVTLEMNGTEFSLETGRMARQANGSVLVGMGDTRALLTVTAAKKVSDRDFLPLFVEYRNKTYAAGKIPGGFFKREARPSEREVLSCRLIDRPLRPLFPDGYRFATDVVAFIVSADEQFHADVLSITAASCALNLSDIPFAEYVSAVRVAEIEGDLIVNPSFEQLEASTMDLVVAGTDDIICMIEGSCQEIGEERLLDAVEFAHEWIRKLNGLQRDLVAKAGGKEKFTVEVKELDEAKIEAVREFVGDELDKTVRISAKMERQDALSALKTKVAEHFAGEDGEPDKEAKTIFGKLEKALMRTMVVKEGVRADGRDLTTVRPITIDLGLLPRVHGSALFTRGETQSLGTVTLGTKMDEQKIDALEGEWWNNYYLHYNFPPFSVGETGRYSGTGRREIGHGKLGERAIKPILPEHEDFPYTIRIVSEILESNGSSSMATVCSGCLALMQAGVPIKKSVAGVAMGLIKEGDDVAVLTDILGVEDHLGDMDFKVTGTRDGITAFQMDTKIGGITREIMNFRARSRALRLCPEDRHHPDSAQEDRRADRPGRQGDQEAPGRDRDQHRDQRRGHGLRVRSGSGQGRRVHRAHSPDDDRAGDWRGLHRSRGLDRRLRRFRGVSARQGRPVAHLRARAFPRRQCRGRAQPQRKCRGEACGCRQPDRQGTPEPQGPAAGARGHGSTAVRRRSWWPWWKRRPRRRPASAPASALGNGVP